MRFAGVGLVMLAAICWGLSGGIGGILMNKGWDPVVISLYRGAVGFICFLGWLLFRWKASQGFSPRLYIWSVLAGVGVAGNFTFYLFGIQNTSISVAATLMYTAPVFVLLISVMFGIERSTWFKWGCIFSVFIGIVLLTGAYSTDAASLNVLGIAGGIAAGLFYTLFIFGFKNASSVGQPQVSLTIAFFSFCIILFTLADKGETVAVLTSDDIWWFVSLGLLGAGISFMLYVLGIRRVLPTTASMVAMVEPVTASLFGFLFLGDYLTVVQLLGMALILFTITFLSKRQSGWRGLSHLN